MLALAATANHGEVNGLGDGLRAWDKSDFDAINDVLTRVPADSAISGDKLHRCAGAMSRTSTFVFYAGDRFFGTVVAYVEDPEADACRFTSSLPPSSSSSGRRSRPCWRAIRRL